MGLIWLNVYFLHKKKEGCLPTTQSFINLKSNTMKNTVQR